MKLNVCVVNMDKYESSADENKRYKDFEKVITLPAPREKLGKIVCETIGQSSVNGYRVSSYRPDEDKNAICDELSYCEDDLLFDINEDLIALNETYFNEERTAIVVALMSEKGYPLRKAIEEMDDYHVYFDCRDEEDLGKAIARDECIDYDSELEDYINWSDFACDKVYGYEFHDDYCIVSA